MTRRIGILAACALLAAACSDQTATAPARLSASADADEAKTHGGEKFVSIGTSISMGWASNGVYAGSQALSWPAQIRFGSLPEISLPLINAPGCQSPLVTPLIQGVRLSGESAAGSVVCAPNAAGVVLPTQNVAIAGALTIEALQTPAPGNLPWYSRVLPPGMTQVTAALSQHPTLVSIELGANEVLQTSSGLVVPGVTFLPYPFFAQAYDAVVGTVGAGVDKVLLVGFLTNGPNLPALRRGDEVWADRAEFAALHVDVSPDCEGNGNYINISVKALNMVFTAAFTSSHQLPNPVFSCTDTPGAQDQIVTAAEIAMLGTLFNQMADHQREVAEQRGYAFVSLDELYNRPDLKSNPYSVIDQLTSNTPYGPYISADGIHPSALGNAVLAQAAAKSLNKTYSGITAHVDDETLSSEAFISASPRKSPAAALELAKRIANQRQGERVSACLLPGGCQTVVR